MSTLLGNAGFEVTEIKDRAELTFESYKQSLATSFHEVFTHPSNNLLVKQVFEWFGHRGTIVPGVGGFGCYR